jgi:hypothetical protein
MPCVKCLQQVNQKLVGKGVEEEVSATEAGWLRVLKTPFLVPLSWSSDQAGIHFSWILCNIDKS